MIASRGWYQWAWSPVVGCKHGCEYCHSRSMFDDYETARINVKALTEPDIQAKLKASDNVPTGGDAQTFAKQIAQESANNARIIKEGNIKAE